METSAIDAGNPFAAGKNNKTGKPASEAFSDLLSTLFSKLGQTAEDDAALDEPFFKARPAERPAAERATPDRSDEIARAEERRAERDEAPEATGYVEAAPEQRAPQARSAADEPATNGAASNGSNDGTKPAADATAKPAGTPAEQVAAKPAPLAAPATAQPTQAGNPALPGNAAQSGAAAPAPIQVTVNEAPVHAQAAQKVAPDAALATQAQGQAPAEDAEAVEGEPRSAAPNANGLVAGKGDQAAGAGNQGNGQGQNGQAQSGQTHSGFANLAAQMLQAAPVASAAGAGAATGFATAPDTPDEAAVTTLPLGAPGAAQAATAAAQRRAETAAAPQLPRLPATEQIAINIQKAIKAGKDQVTIKLQPEELGRIDVKLEVGEDGRVTAQVRAEKPETLELLQRDARGLERALQEAGLRADSGSLSFGLRGENRQDGQHGQQARSTPSPLALNAEQDDITPIIAARSAEGRIDLHV